MRVAAGSAGRSKLVRTTRLWVVVGSVAVVFGVLPILGSTARMVVIVAGMLLLLAATWRIQSQRTGEGSSQSPRDRYPQSQDTGGSG